MTHIKHHPELDHERLTRDEERELAEALRRGDATFPRLLHHPSKCAACRNGDRDPAALLAFHNLRLARATAGQMSGGDDDLFEDYYVLAAASMLQLLRAARGHNEGYDPERPFGPYAQTAMRSAITRKITAEKLGLNMDNLTNGAEQPMDIAQKKEQNNG